MLTDDNIEELKQRVKKFRSTGIKERRTREWLIDFALRFLGWHVSEYKRVKTEYTIAGPGSATKGSQVDYALFAENGNPVVFVEAKRLDGIGEAGVEQLRKYAFNEIAGKITKTGTRNLAPFASLVLTDGNVWKFYPLSHEKGLDYHPQWCHTLNLEVGEAYKIREDLNNLLDIQKVSSGESSKYLEKLFRLDLTEKACEEVLERHQIKREVKLVFGEQREKIAELAKVVMNEVEIQDCDPDQKEVEEAVLKYIIPSPSSVEIPDAKRNHGLEDKKRETTKPEHKATKFQVKYAGKIVKGGKNQIAVMRNALVLFAGDHNVKGMEEVHAKCAAMKTKNPLVLTNDEVKERLHSKQNSSYTKFSEHFTEPEYRNYSYFHQINVGRKKEVLEALAEALGISDRVKIELVGNY